MPADALAFTLSLLHYYYPPHVPTPGSFSLGKLFFLLGLLVAVPTGLLALPNGAVDAPLASEPMVGECDLLISVFADSFALSARALTACGLSFSIFADLIVLPTGALATGELFILPINHELVSIEEETYLCCFVGDEIFFIILNRPMSTRKW